MIKEERAKKIKNFFSVVVEPFALGLLALLFIIPTITVMNLTPITKKIEKLNVLGVSTSSSLSVTLVGGKHDVFTEEDLIKVSDTEYNYSVKLNKRVADNYSKPILELENKTSEVQEISFLGQTATSTRSNINLLIDNKTYKLEDDKGFTYPHEIFLAPSEKMIVFLSVENLTGIQFSETFDMQIKVIENL